MKVAVGVLVLVILVVFGAAWYFSTKTEEPGVSSAGFETYSNPTHGISFKYPQSYMLTEGEHGNAERAHYAIVLAQKSDLPVPENSEGPPSISIDFYQNNLDHQTLLGWLEGSSASNFKLGPGTYASSTVDGAESVAYSWSGLYEGDSVAFLHKDQIVMISVMHLEPNDQIRTDYLNLLASLNLLD